jgi:hypothetical protein
VPNRVRIVGVHPVPAEVPVHLIELEVEGPIDEFDFGRVTQELPAQPPANWQVAYDEHELSREGKHARFAFFFHYLDLGRPLLTPFGPASVPGESALPRHLQAVEYEQP